MPASPTVLSEHTHQHPEANTRSAFTETTSATVIRRCHLTPLSSLGLAGGVCGSGVVPEQSGHCHLGMLSRHQLPHTVNRQPSQKGQPVPDPWGAAGKHALNQSIQDTICPRAHLHRLGRTFFSRRTWWLRVSRKRGPPVSVRKRGGGCTMPTPPFPIPQPVPAQLPRCLSEQW